MKDQFNELKQTPSHQDSPIAFLSHNNSSCLLYMSHANAPEADAVFIARTFAVFSGSSSSAGAGVRAVLTAQNWQPRVHVSPALSDQTLHHEEVPEAVILQIGAR